MTPIVFLRLASDPLNLCGGSGHLITVLRVHGENRPKILNSRLIYFLKKKQLLIGR